VGAEAQVPVPWADLGRRIHPLRGNLVNVLAEPGVGKSAFALNWCVQSEEPSCLLSLDTDLATQAIRMSSILSGVSMLKVKQDPIVWADYLDKKAGYVRAYDLPLESREMFGLLEAETEYWGVPPALTVVDNIGNMVREGSFEDYRRTFADLHRLARVADTCVIVLHHVKRTQGTGKKPTMTSGMYSGEQEAEIVLGLWSDKRELLNVSVLKNRSGDADPNGALSSPLRWDRDTMRMEDLPRNQLALYYMGGVSA